MRVALCVVGAVGCSSATNGFSLDAACTAWAQAFCDRTQACSSEWVAHEWGSVTACKDGRRQECLLFMGAPGSGFNADKLQACTAAFAMEPCDDRLSAVQPEACRVAGTRDLGQGCYYGSQCKSGFCPVAKSAPCGTCENVTQPGVTTCSLSRDCTSPQVCANQVCQNLVGVGGDCSAGEPCSPRTECVAGICQHRGETAGAPCDPNAMSAPPCDGVHELYCGTDLTCHPLTPVPPGASCGTHTYCLDGAKCSGITGLCVPAAQVGATCDPSVSDTCVRSATCIVTSGTMGICQMPDPSVCQ
jgi:hypothetical protein